MFKYYDDTINKYKIINEVTDKEAADIYNRLSQSKSILLKRLEANESKLHTRHQQFSRIEQSLVHHEDLKKTNHKQKLKKEYYSKMKVDQEQVQRRQEEELHHISQHIQGDITQIESKYEHIMQKLGTNDIVEVQEKILKQVIPQDIHLQSIQNTMRDRLE